jgi:putative addiction module component (TIGR02574 family)
MSLTRQELKSEAMKLAPEDREALAEELLLSIDNTSREAIDAAWLAEVHRRDEAFEAGKSAASPVADVVARLQHKARA